MITCCYVLDTNIVLYLLGGRLLQPLPIGEFYLSIITEMELLSYHFLTETEQMRIQALLSQVTIVNLDETVKNQAIALRQRHRLKLPDAIVCATALATNSTLLSNDAQLARVTEITVEAVAIQ
jgi:predicted nucleic acid-binding protein